MQDISSIAGLKFSETSAWLPPPGAQVTMVEAGTNHNVVPDLCRFVVDVRSNDKYGNLEMLEMIRTVCHGELTPRSTRLHPSSLDDSHFLMETVRQCNLDPFGSSTLSDMALIPFPAVKMGPGHSSRSHTAGEFIWVHEIDQAIQQYADFLTKLAENLESTI
jgi:acetylornithine deacetylase